MSQFTNIVVTVAAVDYTYNPYDRGTNGAFVYREVNGESTHAPRAIVSTSMDDTNSDKMTVQLNVPRTCEAETSCGPDILLGTDLVKTEMRFLASTSKADRVLQIDKQIALLEELRHHIEDREVIYS